MDGSRQIYPTSRTTMTNYWNTDSFSDLNDEVQVETGTCALPIDRGDQDLPGAEFDSPSCPCRR